MELHPLSSRIHLPSFPLSSNRRLQLSVLHASGPHTFTVNYILWPPRQPTRQCITILDLRTFLPRSARGYHYDHVAKEVHTNGQLRKRGYCEFGNLPYLPRSFNAALFQRWPVQRHSCDWIFFMSRTRTQSFFCNYTCLNGIMKEMDRKNLLLAQWLAKGPSYLTVVYLFAETCLRQHGTDPTRLDLGSNIYSQRHPWIVKLLLKQHISAHSLRTYPSLRCILWHSLNFFSRKV